MFFEAGAVYFAFFNFSTLLTWIFPAWETESEHNESKSAQIGKFHCLCSKISIEILVVDCILTTKHVPMVSKTVQERFRSVWAAISDSCINGFDRFLEMAPASGGTSSRLKLPDQIWRSNPGIFVTGPICFKI